MREFFEVSGCEWLLHRCPKCRKDSVRHLDNGTHKGWILGCECWEGLDIVRWLPVGILPVIGEKEC